MNISKTRAIALGAVLIVQAALVYGFTVKEVLPPLPPFPSLPGKMGAWEMTGEEELDQATQELLRPDVSVSRTYQNPANGGAVSMFAGYFKTTQANAPAPHSPQVCLPGAGWRGLYLKELTVPATAPGAAPFAFNEFLLEKGKDQILVYYWYQNSQRTWRNELMAKVYILPDLLQYKRTEVALLRVVVKVRNDNLDRAIQEGRGFVDVFHPAVERVFRERSMSAGLQ